MRSFKKTAAILMLVSFIFATVSPAMAGGLAKITDFVGGNGGNAKGNAETIYFGEYWQNGSGTDLSGYTKSGIKWRVLSNTNGKTFLLSDKALYADAFNNNSTDGNRWENSEIRATLNNTTANAGFAGDAFSDKERAAIAETTLSDVTSTDKIFLLSTDEAQKTGYGFVTDTSANDTRKAAATAMAQNVPMYGNAQSVIVDGDKNSNWWLRTQGSSNFSSIVFQDGSIGDACLPGAPFVAVRPALNLKQDSVLFASAAIGGKGNVNVGNGFALADYDGSNGWKLTLKDDGIAAPTNVEVTQTYTGYKTLGELAAATAEGGTMDLTAGLTYEYNAPVVKYTGDAIIAGTANYVSGIVANSAGEYVNYAKISNTADGSAGVSVDFGTLDNGTYKMFVFAEQANGDKETDYASEFSNTDGYEFTKGSATVNEGTLSTGYATKALTANLGGDFNLGFEAGEYDTGVTVGEGDNGTITADATNGTTLTGKITVEENATLATANKFTLKGDSRVEGTLNFDGGSIEAVVNGDNGTTNINGDTENKGAISQKEATVAEGKTLTNNGAIHVRTLNLNNAKIINNADSAAGEVDIEVNTINAEGGVIENYADIEAVNFNGGNDGKLVNGETGEIEIDNITGIVENKGKAEFTNALDGCSFNGTFINKGTLYVTSKLAFTGKLDTKGGTLAFNLDGHKAGDVFIDNDTTANLTGAKVELIQTDEDYKLKNESETMTLVSKAEKYDGAAEIETQDGVHKYKYGVGITDGALMLGYLDQGVADQTKSFSEARLAGSAAINSASDLIAGQAIDSAMSGGSWEAFAAMGGSHSRYETGSHIDLNSLNVAAGLSKKIKDNITLGIFVEGGNGRYTTENEFEDGNVRADGDVNYFGGGIFAKVEGKKTAKGQLHGEASFRAGHMNSDYNSETFNPGESTRFDTSEAYMGAHLGLGYKWSLKDNSNIDTYVKYLWNRQNSDSPVIDGEQFDLDAINSHRLRAGFRYNGKENENGVKFFGGLAYEYEFDGKAKGHMGEYALLEPDFKGGSGMAELGIKYHKANSPWKVELGLTGHTGKRDSIGANLGAWYEFGR